jgi:hypothetical protein
MQLFVLMKKILLPPELDGSYFEDISNFLSLDVSYEKQQLTIETISKIQNVIDYVVPLRDYPILSPLKNFYNLETKAEVIMLYGATNFDWFINTLCKSEQYLAHEKAFAEWLAAYDMTTPWGDRLGKIEVEWFNPSKCYLGYPVNFPEADIIWRNAEPFPWHLRVIE